MTDMHTENTMPIDDDDYTRVDTLLTQWGGCIQEFRTEMEQKHYPFGDDDWIRFLKWVTDTKSATPLDCNSVKQAWEQWNTFTIELPSLLTVDTDQQ